MTYNFLIRLGLGIIFIANALAAFFAPSEFIELIKNSFVINFLPVSPETFVGVGIALNDFLIGVLLISGIATRFIAVWAMAWLVGAMVVIGIQLDALEDFGLFIISVSLALGDRQATNITKNI